MTNPSPIFAYPGAFLPQYGIRSALYVPPPEKIAPGVPKWLGFRYSAVPARGTIQSSMAFEWPFQALALYGHDTDTSGPGGASAGYQINMLHSGPGGTRPLTFRPALLDSNLVGSAELPSFMLEPYFFGVGETLQIEIRNLSTVAVNIIEVVIAGVMINADAVVRWEGGQR